MVVGEVLLNFTDIIYALPPNIAEKAGGLITILKAVGIVAIIYVIYAVTMGVLNFYKIRRIRHIEEKVDLINKKINKLLKKKKK